MILNTPRPWPADKDLGDNCVLFEGTILAFNQKDKKHQSQELALQIKICDKQLLNTSLGITPLLESLP
jgi:hypothetical protein